MISNVPVLVINQSTSENVLYDISDRFNQSLK